jgi:hypothetical protein
MTTRRPTGDGAGAMLPCPWCGELFAPRASGGRGQRFCSLPHRRAWEATAGRLGEAILEELVARRADDRDLAHRLRDLEGPLARAIEEAWDRLALAGWSFARERPAATRAFAARAIRDPGDAG